VLKPEKGSSFALFGCGGVGLAALMGARIAGCDPIVAVDKVPSRLDLARKLGATHVIDASKDDPVARLTGMGGMHYVIEAAGITSVIAQAIQATRSRGICGILGVVKPDATLTVNVLQAFSGRTIMGIIEGDADPHVFIPYLVDKFMAGELPLDLLVRFYPFEEINKAVADSESGVTVKPILRMA
jgi:aryl-alcohol dehydrogenase